METEPGRFLRTLFTLLALGVVSLPVLGWLASSHSVRWGTVPEWIAALSLLLIAMAIWRLVHDRTRAARDSATQRADV